MEDFTLPEVSVVTGEDVDSETSTPVILSSSVEEDVTDTSLVTPSLPVVTEQDRGGAGEGEDELLLGRRSSPAIFSVLS